MYSFHGFGVPLYLVQGFGIPLYLVQGFGVPLYIVKGFGVPPLYIVQGVGVPPLYIVQEVGVPLYLVSFPLCNLPKRVDCPYLLVLTAENMISHFSIHKGERVHTLDIAAKGFVFGLRSTTN